MGPERRVRKSGGPRVAVLMYHNVCTLPVKEAGHYCHVLPHQFAEQMNLLRCEGWRVVRLGDVVGSLKEGRQLPEGKNVAITFDDGYREVFLRAWPMLKDIGFPATVFLATGFVGRREFGWLRTEGRACPPAALAPMSWDEVREMAMQGAEIGAHTVSHLPLAGLSARELHLEVQGSARHIEEHTGKPPSLFSPPFAFPESAEFSGRLKMALRLAGYKGCVTTKIGRVHEGSDPLLLPRLPVSAADSLSSFAAKLRGRYDWLRLPQYVWKRWLKREPGQGLSVPSPKTR